MAAGKRSTKSNSSRDKRKATTQPVGDVSELLTYWDRAFDLKNGYQGLVVEVIARENNVLAFYLLDDEGNPQRKGGEGAFTINLDDGMEAWSSLPSTAQEVDPESSPRSSIMTSPTFLPWMSRCSVRWMGADWRFALRRTGDFSARRTTWWFLRRERSVSCRG